MKWKPERWVTKDLGHILDQAAFFPFSYGTSFFPYRITDSKYCGGPTNCVGKNLALYELRTTICSVLQRFEVKSAPAFDASRWNDDLRDHSIYVKGELPTRIELRKWIYLHVAHSKEPAPSPCFISPQWIPCGNIGREFGGNERLHHISNLFRPSPGTNLTNFEGQRMEKQIRYKISAASRRFTKVVKKLVRRAMLRVYF